MIFSTGCESEDRAATVFTAAAAAAAILTEPVFTGGREWTLILLDPCRICGFGSDDRGDLVDRGDLFDRGDLGSFPVGPDISPVARYLELSIAVLLLFAILSTDFVPEDRELLDATDAIPTDAASTVCS